MSHSSFNPNMFSFQINLNSNEIVVNEPALDKSEPVEPEQKSSVKRLFANQDGQRRERLMLGLYKSNALSQQSSTEQRQPITLTKND